jgi:hypothetical protein
MRLTLVLSGLIVALMLLASGTANAADADWLIGHWDGHNTKNPGDKRHFVLDVVGVKSDQSFVAQWSIDTKTSSGQGKLDSNAVTITFPNGNVVSLLRANDGGLAGSTAPKDGSPGITLVFAKGNAASAAAPSAAAGSDKTCTYHMPVPKGVGPTVHANSGDVVVTREGQMKCVNGRLIPVN